MSEKCGLENPYHKVAAIKNLVCTYSKKSLIKCIYDAKFICPSRHTVKIAYEVGRIIIRLNSATALFSTNIVQ